VVAPSSIELIESLRDPLDLPEITNNSNVNADCEASGGQDAEAGLTAEALLAGGMSRVEAWIAAPSGKAKRKARNKRYREQQAASGLMQLSVLLPIMRVPEFKELASRACETGERLTSDGVTPQAEKQSPSQAPEIDRQFEQVKDLLVTISDELSAGLRDALQSNETLRAMMDEARETENTLRKRIADLEAQERKQRDIVTLGRQVSALNGVRGFLLGVLLRTS
jgi:hypothetical protein